MSGLSTAHTLSPQGLLMPLAAQQLTTIVYGLGAIVFVVYALILCRRHRTMLPMYFILGSLLTIYLEPVVDALGNAVHPQIGQYNILTTNGHPVPVAVLLGYVWYFAALPLLCFTKFKDRSLRQGFVWKCFAGIVIGAATVEQIPLFFGVWEYYGYQPFKIAYMPSWWIFANTSAVLVPFLICYALVPKIVASQHWLIALCLPCGAFMGHAGAGWPMYNALGTDTLTFPNSIIQFSSLLTVGLAVMLIWVLMKIIDVPK